MQPSELSSRLRHVASRLDMSKSPSREMVLKDLRKILASITGRSQSGDPMTNGYDVHVTKRDIYGCDVEGVIFGVPVKGLIELLPDESGNIIGTEWSGGELPPNVYQQLIDIAADHLDRT